MNKHIIRRVTKKDIKYLYKLLNRTDEILGDKDDLYSIQTITDYINRKHDVFLVYTINKKIVGTIYAQFYTEYIYEAIGVVDPKYRKKGIATKLLKRIEEIAKNKGINFIEGFVEVSNKKMQKLYEKLGYIKGKPFIWYSKHGV